MRPALTAAVALLSVAASAQAFSPGWYVVEAAAEFVVLQPSAQDPEGQPMWIAAGEALVCYDRSGDTTFCFEQHGRMSALRGAGALTPAAPGGKPGYVTRPVQLLDRTLPAGMVLWITGLDAAAGAATVQLASGRSERLPADSVTILSNAYRNGLAGQPFTTAAN